MISLAYAALWFFVFSLPWENAIVVPGIGVISKLTGMVAFGLALLAALISGRVRRWHAFHVLAMLFVIWAACGVYLLGMQNIPKKIWTYAQLFLVLWMIWELAPSGRRVLGLLGAYVFGAYVSALDTILLSRREAGLMRRFAAGEFDPNDLAMILALALPMAWYLGMTHHKPLFRWIFRGYLPVGLVAIGLTGSRGGMLAGMTALLIVPLTMTKLSPGRIATSIAMLGIACALAVAYIPETVVQRLGTTSTEVEGGRLGGRFKLWVAGTKAFTLKPLVGYGAAGFKTAISPYLGSAAQVAHNSYISVLVEEGLIGFLLYMAMLGAVFLAVLKLPQLERRFALVLLATLGVAMMPLTWEDRRPVWFILAALLGLSQANFGGALGAGRQPDLRQAIRRGGPAAPPRLREPLTAPHRNAQGDGRA
jgi:O-antigen ligase